MTQRPFTRLLAVLLAAALAAPLAAHAAAPEPLSVESFSRRVTEARSLVQQRLPTIDQRPVAGEVVSKVIVLLPVAERVQLDGNVITVDHGLLRALLAKLDVSHQAATRRELGGQILEYLTSLEAAMPAPSATGVPSDPAALRRLVAAQRPKPDNSALARLVEWVNEVLAKIARWFADSALAPSSGPVATTAWMIVLGGALLLALWGAWRVALAWRRTVRARDIASAEEPALPVVAAEADLPADVLGYAETLAREGRFRDAVRALFGGAARRLADAGMLTRTRTRTNAELLAEVPATTPVRPPLADLTGEFEVAWYGHVEPDRGGYGSAKTHYEQVVQALERQVRRDEANAAAAPATPPPGGERER
jgi:hypothetical protein